jgi:hypothetical protein
MGKVYLAGEQLPASELNKFVAASGLYGVSSNGTDAYAITVSPVPTSYVAGDSYMFKADVSNTGAATLNVNGLGAKTLKKEGTFDLRTGDIKAGQICRVTYDGTYFQLTSAIAPGYSSGLITRDKSSASGSVTIAHGLGSIPKRIRVKTVYGGTEAVSETAEGVYDGITTSGVYVHAEPGRASYFGSSSTNILTLGYDGSNKQEAVATVDATNITLTWTKTGSPAGTAYILWEAFC